MKSMEAFLVQGLILSLTTQFAWSLVEPEAAASQPQGIVGALYRSAAMKQHPPSASSEKEGTDLSTGLSRGQRCVRCGTGYGGYGNYADRYYDDYYYNRDYYNRGGGSYYGREDPLYYGRDQYYGGRDRNWYYQQDARTPYERAPYDRYNYNRYEDRFYGRNNPYDYDPYYSANAGGGAGAGGGSSNYYNSYRGNGYDNLNPAYYEAMRDRFQRDRSYGYDQYYDRYNDRPAYRGYYDNRNFRPYDETYRGTAGFDYSGRGYYFANQNGVEHRPPPPPPSPYDPQSPPPPPPPPNYRPNFYEQAHKPQPLPSSNGNGNPYYNNLPQSQHSPHTTPVIPPEFYQGKPAAHPSSSSSSHTQTVSSNTIGVDGGGSAASNANRNNSNSNNELDNKDKVSTAYGGRPQSLGSSYLFERTDDEANPAGGAGMNPPSLTGDTKQESANMEMKKE